ncbi:MAG TPA: carboxypeptidase-like regulatory domain-containing protein [Bacteroidia bacterium]|jgi:hypothetical protein|nr:carboxypeptidase-like regulatory domain-containing protein [Bacteroidia bacterium]
MYKRSFLLILVVFAGIFNQASAQKSSRHLIQFSGVVVGNGDLKPIPYTAILIKSNYRGTICDNNGYFSFVAQTGDTIEFSSIGYKQNSYTIPDTLTDRYALIHLMDKDTNVLHAVIVYPWPSREAFKHAFLQLNIPDDDLDRAKKNIALAEKRAKMEGMPMDANANFMNTMQQEYSKLYYAGQLPTNNLLNPLAWSSFIQAWKNGDLKIQ